MRASTFIFLFTIAIIKCQSQKNPPDTSNITYSLSGIAGYNSIWTGRGSLQQFKKDHPWLVQLDFGSLRNTQHSWNYCNCYAQNGVSLSYVNFANPEKLGSSIAIAGFTEPYLFFKNRFQLSVRGSAGFTFLNQVYDSIASKDNIFFSTNLSFILGLGVNLSWRINNNWKLRTSAQFNHISNAGRKDPNEGMNFPGVGIGIIYELNPQKLERRPSERFSDKSINLVVHGFGNVRTAWADANWPEERRVVAGANIGLIKRVGRVTSLGAGGEFYYDGINEVYQQRSRQTIQTTVGGLSLQHYLILGKLLFGQQFAWYVTSNTGYQKNIYQRYILEYEVKRDWYAGFTLKAHGDHSDFFAFSTGYFLKLPRRHGN